MGQSVADLLQAKPVIASSSGYATFDGSTYLSVPDGPELAFSGSFEVTAHVKMNDWTPSTKQTIVSQIGADGNRSWMISIDTLGDTEWTWLEDGSTFRITTHATPLPDPDGWLWYRGLYRYDAEFGHAVYRHWWSSDGVWWGYGLGTILGASAPVYDSTARLIIGGTDGQGQMMQGSVDYISLVDVDKDEEVFRFDGASITSASQPTIPTTTGQTITVHGATLTPPVLRGQPIGVGDWRMFVERLNGYVDGTDEPFIVGAFKVGAAAAGGDDPKVGAQGWEDLTDRWRGSSILRGADEPYGRPRVGEMVMTLDNRDDYLSPTVNYSDTRPGVIVRISLASATDARANGWLPIFTGLVDSWIPYDVGARPSNHSYADSYVEVRLVETLAAIARIDDNATTTQGAGETFTPRIKRLFNAARWRYGFVTKISSAVESITLQSTDMAKPRLEEAYLTGDSTLRAVRSDVTGAACLTDPNLSDTYHSSRLGDFSWSGLILPGFADAGKPLPWLQLQPHSENLNLQLKGLMYDAESLIIANDPEHLINDVRYARAGGTQQVAENKVSIGRFGRATLARGDLLNNSDAQVLQVARARCNQTARTTFRIDELRVTTTGKDDLYTLILAALDLGDYCSISPRADDIFNASAVAHVRTIIHEITPLRPGALAWTSTLAFDVTDLFNFPPGSFLPGFDL